MSDLHKHTASEMALRIRRKEISPVELIRAHLDRVDALQPKLNAFVCVDRERALRDAAAAESAALRGDSLGPLHGVPVTAKSCIDMQGLRCEAGSHLRRDYIAQHDAPLISRLRASGAIVIGNTNVPEFLMAYETDNRLQGRTSNPWDLSRTSGGSSGGESAAIAAGCSAGGVGSDGGGSIRVPAHFCGICGLKPTPGRIPGTGHFPVGAGPFAWLGVVGPMARSVADLQILFQAMTGPDDGDPLAAPIPLQQISEESARKIRVGFFADDGLAPVTAESRAAVHSACAALKSAGFEVVEFLPKDLPRIHELWWTVFGRMVYMALDPGVAGRDADLSPILREYMSVVCEETPLTASSLLNILLERDAVRASFLQQMNEFPILVCPVSAGPANLHGTGTWKLDCARTPWREGMRFSQWFNLLGLPAAVVPVGKSTEGLPIGVQIVGKPFQEMEVLAVATQIEAASTRGLWQQPPAI